MPLRRAGSLGLGRKHLSNVRKLLCHPRHGAADADDHDPKSGVAYKDTSGPTAARWANTCAGVPGACGTTSDSGSGVTTVTLTLRDTRANTCWTGSGTAYATCGAPLAVTGTTIWSKAIAFAVVTGPSRQITATVTDLAGNVAKSSVTFSAS
jgi:hypothetical protein